MNNRKRRRRWRKETIIISSSSSSTVRSRDSCAAGRDGSRGRKAFRWADDASTRTSGRRYRGGSEPDDTGTRPTPPTPPLARTGEGSPRRRGRPTVPEGADVPAPGSPTTSRRRTTRHSSLCICPVQSSNQVNSHPHKRPFPVGIRKLYSITLGLFTVGDLLHRALVKYLERGRVDQYYHCVFFCFFFYDFDV